MVDQSTSAALKADEQLLTIDIGNTNVVLGVFGANRLLQQWRLTTEARRTADEVRIYLNELFRLSQLELGRIKGIMAASVAPAITDIYLEALASLLEAETLVLDHETPVGLVNAYRNPEEVGADRLANAVGGKLSCGLPLIIVDFGSAITLDVLSRNNEYLGGIIMPGLEMASEALYQKTAKLPQVAVHKPKQLIGVSTEMSIRSGLFYGVLGAIESVIERIRKELGEEVRAIATGGAGQDIVEASQLIDSYDPHLTLHGLQEIWRLNHASA